MISILFYVFLMVISEIGDCSAELSIQKQQCLPWEVLFKNTSECICRRDLFKEMKCSDGKLYVEVNRCLSYENSTLYEAACPHSKYQHLTKYSFLKVPTNLSRINGFFCDPLNREGLICGQCKEGYGLSVLRVGYKCVKCSQPWRGWLLYIFFQFVPVTIFYLIIFSLQISITTTVNCFVFYSQIIVGAFTYDELVINNVYMKAPPFLQTFFNIMITLYEPWNLEFFLHVVPDFCLSTTIRNIHMGIFRYISAVYYLILIVLTYMIMKLNDFTCKVTLFQKFCRPIKSSMRSIRSIWNPKASVIDVIATLFLLSYTKIFLNASQIFRYSHIKNITAQPPQKLYTVVHVDPNVRFYSSEHIFFVIPTVAILAVMACIFMLLTCYPFRTFRKALTCCCGTRTLVQHINTFVEKLQGHYKDGTDNSSDMRLFSVLYLFLRPFLILASPVLHIPSNIVYLVRGLIAFAASIAVLTARPYKKDILSTYDGLLLALTGLLGILIQLIVSTSSLQLNSIAVIYLLAFLMAIPQVILMIVIVIKVVQGIQTKCKYPKYQDVAGDDFIPDRMINIDRYCQQTGKVKNTCCTEQSHLLA